MTDPDTVRQVVIDVGWAQFWGTIIAGGLAVIGIIATAIFTWLISKSKFKRELAERELIRKREALGGLVSYYMRWANAQQIGCEKDGLEKEKEITHSLVIEKDLKRSMAGFLITSEDLSKEADSINESLNGTSGVVDNKNERVRAIQERITTFEQNCKDYLDKELSKV